MNTWSFVHDCWTEGKVDSAQYYWFALDNSDAGELAQLADRYHLHPLAVEDCLSPLLHAPKIDDFGSYIFLVLHAIALGIDGRPTEEFDAFLGQDVLITYVDRMEPFQEMFAAVRDALTNGRPVRSGVDGLLYELADRMVDAALPQVNTLSNELDGLQQGALEAGSSREHREIMQVRARAGTLRRLLTAELSVMQRLSRGEFSQVSPPNQIYFRDIYDHLVRIDLSLESLREDAEVALSTSLNVLNNQINEVMKVLAIVGALALPATLIAGIFGTNFDNVPWLHTSWGFGTMMGLMAAIAAGMAGYFWRRGWF